MPGTRLQRRLAAILAADVVGYSRLMGIDEAGTLARLQALRRDPIDPTIAAHSGRIVKLIGDGELVEFASAVDAVTCAIKIQELVRERFTGRLEENSIQFRMGINIGDVIIEGEDIYGDGVNIAARLEGIAEAGGLSISEDAWRQIKGKIAVDFVDIGEKDFKNIARPIRVYRLDLRSGTLPKTAAAGIGVARKPAIAVLPFQNMSGDPEQEHFADGMVEDIITGLSRIDGLFVIARNSSFVYKGKPVDVRQAGRELGVRYLLEGSVRKAGDRFRVTAQLIDAERGAHLWADKFDGGVDNVFDLQDRIAASVVEVVEPSLRQAEIERAWRKRPDDFAA
jgi:TolB-like protein